MFLNEYLKQFLRGDRLFSKLDTILHHKIVRSGLIRNRNNVLLNVLIKFKDVYPDGRPLFCNVGNQTQPLFQCDR